MNREVIESQPMVANYDSTWREFIPATRLTVIIQEVSGDPHGGVSGKIHVEKTVPLNGASSEAGDLGFAVALCIEQFFGGDGRSVKAIASAIESLECNEDVPGDALLLTAARVVLDESDPQKRRAAP